MRPLVALCRLGLGRLHAVSGHRGPAELELADARRLFQNLGMTARVTDVDALLAGPQ